MSYDSDQHHRKSIRLHGYDYAQPGFYFVTICTFKRRCLFGVIKDGEMLLSEIGQIAHQEWLKTPQIRPYVRLDTFIIVPNHLRGIIEIVDQVGVERRSTPTTPTQFGYVPG